jgi:hypothetical protein
MEILIIWLVLLFCVGCYFLKISFGPFIRYIKANNKWHRAPGVITHIFQRKTIWVKRGDRFC